MDFRDLISSARAKFAGFNPPGHEEALSQLQILHGFLPEDVQTLYRDHDGSDRLPAADGMRLVARLMPIAEAIKTNNTMRTIDFAKVGAVVWLWTDDNSNYCGIYTDGLLRGWLCVLDHEEPMLAPAFRSVASFSSRLLAAAINNGERRACDIPSLPREIPETIADSENLEKDRELCSRFRQVYKDEVQKDMRRLFGFCSICLTPVEDTKKVMAFFEEVDMWTPEAAVRLLEVRRWRGEVEEIERLASNGSPNGDGAAMRLLARMNTDQSRRAITLLKQKLQGQKLKMLEMWTERKLPLQPPRW